MRRVCCRYGAVCPSEQCRALGRGSHSSEAIRTGEFSSALQLMKTGQLDSNLVFFALPSEYAYTKEQYVRKLSNDFNIKLESGYSKTYHEEENYFRAAVHMDVDEEGIDREADAIVALC